MKILMVASEVAPYAKTGGLADVTGSLPRALKRMGHDVRIIMPFYRSLETGRFPIKKGRKSVEILLNGEERKGLLRFSMLDGIPVYFIENREYFSREYLYGTPKKDYPDNAERFAFFSRGVLQLLKRMDFRPDIIHCHDWQTALIPLLLRYELREDPFFCKTAVVFTIHNIAYQGLFRRDSLPSMGLKPSYLRIDRLEYYGKVNLMKGAILNADIITTVSGTYCREIQTPEFGYGLEGVVADRSKDLYGIINGIDNDLWNPATDGAIFKKYGQTSLAGKSFNKKRLQKLLGLAERPDVPLMAIVTRLAAQKGIDLVEELLPRFVQEDLQLVILGVGDQKYLDFFQEFLATHPGNISINLDFAGELGHRIYAGSDMFLMPSQYEPCGLGQLIALRYGSVPVVRKTGGLADTVVDEQDNAREANGFTFADYTAEAFWEAITRAIAAFRNRKGWEKLIRRGMMADHSWANSALLYEDVYRKALARKVC